MKDQQHAVTLAEKQLFVISGGRSHQVEEVTASGLNPSSPPTFKEPIYITMAIGEGGGTLPDILA